MFTPSASNPIASIAKHYLEPVTKDAIEALTIANQYADFCRVSFEHGRHNINVWQQKALNWFKENEESNPLVEEAATLIAEHMQNRLVMILDEEKMLKLLKAEEKLQPITWQQSNMLRDGYCCVKGHTFHEATPKTVGFAISPVTAGVREALRKYGNKWKLYVEPKESQESKDRALKMARDVVSSMVSNGYISTVSGTSAYHVGKDVVPIIMGKG